MKKIQRQAAKNAVNCQQLCIGPAFWQKYLSGGEGLEMLLVCEDRRRPVIFFLTVTQRFVDKTIIAKS